MSNLYIKCLKSEKIESGARYGQFLINSLRPGQGITVGNLLRRVLLSDIGGTTITAVRIAGVRDEFSIIPGVREDVLEILLNLKGTVFQSKSTDTQFGRLKVKGPAVITASSIQGPSDLEIVNPNHYIATISTNGVLEIEFKFEYGTGYKLAGQTFCDKSEDFLQMDAIFMPIQKVDFKIENVYDNTNYVTERLFIDIWTNGSISPEDAISSASEFIIDLFNSLLLVLIVVLIVVEVVVVVVMVVVVAEAVAATVWVAAGERVSIEKTPAVVISADDGAASPAPVTEATVFDTKIAYGN